MATVSIKKTRFRFFKQDRLGFGIILGFIAPILGFVLYYFLKLYPLFTFKEYLSLLYAQRSLVTAISSLSLLANAVIFTLYINNRKDLTAKGVFLATCVCGIASLLLKLL